MISLEVDLSSQLLATQNPTSHTGTTTNKQYESNVSGLLIAVTAVFLFQCFHPICSLLHIAWSPRFHNQS